MADRIKGITIEIGGDTTKLADALKGVNKEINACQTALRDIGKLLKLDPGNVDLLRQKQGYLKDEINATQEKLKLEKQALQELKNANSTGEVTEEQKRLEREIVETESSLKSLKKEYKNFGGVATQVIRNAGTQMKGFGDKMTGAGKALTTKVTAPILAIGAASVAAFNEVDAGLDIVAAKTGATGDALAGMESIVKGIATEIPTDFETAGSAVGEVATRFKATGAELQRLSTTYIKFAKINNTDVAGAIDSTQKALGAFGLDASSADQLLDALTATSQGTGASVDSLTAGLIQNGTAFQEMGLTVDQAVAAMGMMETSGANSETVMQGLRKALKSATEDGIPLNEALIALQTTIMDDTSATGGLTAAYELFGKSGDQIYAAVKNGTLDFASLGEQAIATGGSVSTTFEGMLDPTDQATVAINAAKVAGAELGTTLLTMAAPVIEQVTELIKNLTAWFQSLSPQTQENIVKFVAIAAAIGPVITVVGGLVSGLGTLVSAFNPVTAIIMGVVAAGVALYTNWDTVCQWAKTLGAAVKATFSVIGTTVSNIWGKVTSATKTAWEAVKNAIMKPLESAKTFVGNAIDKIRGFFKFDWSLPKLKLPHVSISGSFSLWPPSIPHFSIEWYRKAYDNPVIFDRPTVVPTASGAKGFGDGNGSEIVIGMNKLQELVGGAGNTYSPTFNVYAQPGEDTETLARRIQDTFVRWTQQEQEARGFA
jgi:phage-related minor tail protein